MKVILNERQYELYKHFLKENLENEGRSVANLKGYKDKIQPMLDKLGRELYGDEFGTINQDKTTQYQLEKVPLTNDLQLATGLFSVGNAKLSDDTLIINFTSGLQCPSVALCPVTQKACYAVAGELRIPEVRRKNLKVQEMWKRAIKNNKIGEVFGIAQMYIEILQKTKKPIRYVRFNEAGDFLNQDILDAAALFASTMRKQYGIMSMAYTANSRLDFRKEIDGEPIDKIIKINASRLDIKLSDDSVNNKFLATSMDFETALAENDKVVSISESELIKNKLECLGVLKDPDTGIPSIPVLANGKWSGGSGLYYVCPCSFWGYNKTKKTLQILKLKKLIGQDVEYMDKKELSNFLKTVPKDVKELVKRETDKIKSPSGTQCAVCHNMSGGVKYKDVKNFPNCDLEKEYTVLEATHGATSSNYKPEYANALRNGEKAIYSPENPHGRVTKFDIVK